MNDISQLTLVLSDDNWHSPIRLDGGLTPKPGGTLVISADANQVAQLFRQPLDLFDWNDILDPSNTFDRIELPAGTEWDLSRLYLSGEISLMAVPGGPAVCSGDANQDLRFDQLDLVQVLQAGKYLTGEPATWGEGDWDAGYGGYLGNPPLGDGIFDQRDIITVLGGSGCDVYLTGPYAANAMGGMPNDGQASVVYTTGHGNGSRDVDVASVPEPSTTALLGLGLCLCLILGWMQTRLLFTGTSLARRNCGR